MQPSTPTNPNPNDGNAVPVGDLKSSALQAAEELRAVAGAKAEQMRQTASNRGAAFSEAAGQHADNILDYADTSMEDIKKMSEEFKVDAEKYIRENPTKAVLTALGVGFVVGAIFRR